MNTNTNQTTTNVQRATYQLMRDPRFCTIALYMLGMEIIEDPSVGTACTDCVREIRYNPAFMDGLTVEETKFILIHEVYHKFLNFFPRFERWARKYPTHDRMSLLSTFNRAQDYLINWTIVNQWRIPMPAKEGLYDDQYTPSRWTAEKIADTLMTAPPPPPPPGRGGSEAPQGDGETGTSAGNQSEGKSDAGDGEGESSPAQSPDAGDADAGNGADVLLPKEYNGDINNVLSEQQIKELEHDNQMQSHNAERMSRPMRGIGETDGAGEGSFEDQISASNHRATYAWRERLKRYAKASASNEFSYSRASRRRVHSAQPLIPGRVGKQLGTAVFVIDSSGSTSGSVIDYCFDEMERALMTAEFKKAVIVWCSDGVPSNGGVQEYTAADVKAGKLDRRRRRVGGGTRFVPAFKAIVANGYKDADVMTYFTDGGVRDTEIEASMEVWASELGRMPLLWALADDGWSCTEHFTVEVNKRGFGQACDLPMDAINS